MNWSGKAKILIVDDNPEKLLALQSLLSNLNQEVLTAKTGAEALRLLLREEFAVIVLDVHMPGMSGLQTAQSIRQRESSKDTPILFVTSYDSSSLDLQKVYSLGAVDFVDSPIIPQIVAAKVSTQISIYRRTKALERAQADLEAAIQQRTAALEEANERLAASEELYRTISETVADAIVSINEEGVILAVNPAAERIFGSDPGTLVGQPLTVLIPARMHARLQEALKEFFLTGEQHIPWTGIEVPGLRKDGTEILLERSGPQCSNHWARFLS
jgi:PAS domain S-box-containing protein